MYDLVPSLFTWNYHNIINWLYTKTREGNGNPLQNSRLENPVDRGALVGCWLWGRTESDTTEAT